MSLKNFENDMLVFQELFNSYNDEMENFYKIGFEPGFKLSEITYKILEKYLDFISEKYNINIQNLDWFVYENDFGNKKYTCTMDKFPDKIFIIDSIESFYNFEKDIFNFTLEDFKNDHN